MYRLFVFLIAIFVSTQGFAQQHDFRVSGRIPNPNDSRLYEIQVGFFRDIRFAQNIYERLSNAQIYPAFINDEEYIRVVVTGIPAAEVPSYMERIRDSGIQAIFVRQQSAVPVPRILPVSDTVLPASGLREIASKTIAVRETVNLTPLTAGRNVVSWTSSTPSIINTDANGNVTGTGIGSGYVLINNREYISITVVPGQDFFIVPDTMASLLPPESNAGNIETKNLEEYKTEPTFRLAYRFVNKDEQKGASRNNGGIDILGRGPNYEWLWTTYRQGGWIYDLNGIRSEMVDGFQKDPNGVELKLQPEFVYDNGTPYLQIKHVLYNPNNYRLTGQKFGATADIMIHNNDRANLTYTPYGAYMANSEENPELELKLIALSGSGITPVDTLWLGIYAAGHHVNQIYNDSRENVTGYDSAIAFSYQNINLNPGEKKEFIIRFTLARNEN